MNNPLILTALCFFLFLNGCEPSRPAKSTPPRMLENKIEVTIVQNKELTGTQNVAATRSTTREIFKPFYIYKDKGFLQNHYVPSGFMPDGRCLNLNEAWTEECRSGKSCIRVVYDLACSRAGQRWAGIYWMNPPNNWGKRKGGYNLSGASELKFWARGDQGGEQIQEFTVGGIMGDYPDSDIAVLGPVILTDEWKEYTIDLRGKDLSYISGGFSWSTSEDVNADTCVFYLDDIRFE